MKKRTYQKKLLDKTMHDNQKKLVDKTMELASNHFLSIGDLVYHTTVPNLGYGLVVSENEKHKDYWIVRWCDERYRDVGQLGIHAKYLTKVN